MAEMKKKRVNRTDLTLRNLAALNKRFNRLDQKIVLLEGDRNKTNALVNELRVTVDRLMGKAAVADTKGNTTGDLQNSEWATDPRTRGRVDPRTLKAGERA
jgi:hypothetical protein